MPLSCRDIDLQTVAEMKIVFTTPGNNLAAELDPSFGRAQFFLVYDLDAQAFEVRANQQNLEASQGAGIQAAQNLVKAGADVLITGHCGPKAFRVLQAAGIKVFNTQATTVQQALSLYQSGALLEAKAANIEGHWV